MPNFVLQVQTMRGTTAYPVEIYDFNTALKDLMDYAIEFYKHSTDSATPPIRIKPDEEIFFYFQGGLVNPEDTLASAGIADGGAVEVFIDSQVAAGPPGPAPAAHPVVYDNTVRRVADIEILKRMAQQAENANWLHVKPIDSFKLELIYEGIKGVKKIDQHGHPVMNDRHVVQLTLGAKYPIEKPIADLAPDFSLFHPNVNFEKGNICYATNWNELDADLCYVAVQISHVIQFEPKLVNLDEVDARMNEAAKAWFIKYSKEHPDFFPTDRVKLRNPLEANKQQWRTEFVVKKPIGPMPTRRAPGRMPG